MKNVIATRYGVDTVMPEATRIGVENLKKGESDKRKKAWEDKEGPPTKKQKKVGVVEEEKGKRAPIDARRVCSMSSMLMRTYGALQNDATGRCRRRSRRRRKQRRRTSG